MDFSSTDGTNSIVSSPALSGGYSFRTNPTTTGVGSGLLSGAFSTTIANPGAIDQATAYWEFYFRVDTLPASASEMLCQVIDVAVGLKIELRITSAGVLAAYDSTGTTLLDTGATVLSTATRYRIGIKCETGASVAWSVQINGAAEISGSGASLGTGNNAYIRLGKVANRNGQTVDFFYGALIVSTSAFLGSMPEVGMLVPDGDGSTQDWDSGTGTTFAEVDERPPATTEYLMTAAGAATKVGLLAMQPASTISITGTIHAVRATCRLREDAAGTSNCLVRLRVSSSNTDTPVFNSGTGYATRGLIALVDPSTSAAWTTGGIDSAEVGAVDAPADAAVQMRMDTAYLAVLWTPAVASTYLGVAGPAAYIERPQAFPVPYH
jgi:hypothetical protein